MVNTYKHYGVDVIRQVVEEQTFKGFLRKNGVYYTELPIPGVDVIKYTKDGEPRYALIRQMDYPDVYCETIYMTAQTPDDCNWGLLVKDIEEQHKGAAPMIQNTRLKMIIEQATGQEVTDPGKIALWLVDTGYTKADIEAADKSDIDPEFLEAVVKKMI